MDLNPYAKFLASQDPIRILTTTTESLHALTTGLSGMQLNHVPAQGKWSIREILAHLADCEMVFSFRLRQTLADDHHIVQPFDQDRWAARYAAYDTVSALALFQAARNWNLRFLTSVSESDRSHPITHPERGTMTFWNIVETMAGHDLNHLQQIERLAGNT